MTPHNPAEINQAALRAACVEADATYQLEADDGKAFERAIASAIATYLASLPQAGEAVAWRRMNKQRSQSTGVTDVKYCAEQWQREGDFVEPLYTHPSPTPAPDAGKGGGEPEWRCLKCGAQADERWNCCEIMALTSTTDPDAGREAKRNKEFSKHTNWRLFFDGKFYCDDDNPDLWTVTEEYGNVNDRECRVIGTGKTAMEAIDAAIRARQAP